MFPFLEENRDSTNLNFRNMKEESERYECCFLCIDI